MSAEKLHPVWQEEDFFRQDNLRFEPPWEEIEGHIMIVSDIEEQPQWLGNFLHKMFPRVHVLKTQTDTFSSLIKLHKVDLLLIATISNTYSLDALVRQARLSHPSTSIFLLTPAIKKAPTEEDCPWEGHTKRMNLPLTRNPLAHTISRRLEHKRHSITMNGALSSDELVDILQLIAHKRQSCLIEIEAGLTQGWMWFVEGKLRGSMLWKCAPWLHGDFILGITSQKQQGSEAFNTLLHEPSHFWIHSQTAEEIASYPHNISASWEYLVLEAARLRDESTRGFEDAECSSFSQEFDASPASNEPAVSPSFDSLLNSVLDSSPLASQKESHIPALHKESHTPESRTPKVPKETLKGDAKETNMKTPLEAVQSCFPNAVAVVLVDAFGSVNHHQGDVDAETVAATVFYTMQSLEQVGELLGMGEPMDVGFESERETWLLLREKKETLCCFGKRQQQQLPRLLEEAKKSIANNAR